MNSSAKHFVAALQDWFSIYGADIRMSDKGELLVNNVPVPLSRISCSRIINACMSLPTGDALKEVFNVYVEEIKSMLEESC